MKLKGQTSICNMHKKRKATKIRTRTLKQRVENTYDSKKKPSPALYRVAFVMP